MNMDQVLDDIKEFQLILIRAIIVYGTAGNSHIFREICRDDITLAIKQK